MTAEEARKRTQEGLLVCQEKFFERCKEGIKYKSGLGFNDVCVWDFTWEVAEPVMEKLKSLGFRVGSGEESYTGKPYIKIYW